MNLDIVEIMNKLPRAQIVGGTNRNAQVIKYIESCNLQRILLVAPLSTHDSWYDDLIGEAVIVKGSPAQKREALRFKDHAVTSSEQCVIITPQSLHKYLDEVTAQQWDMVIVVDAHVVAGGSVAVHRFSALRSLFKSLAATTRVYFLGAWELARWRPEVLLDNSMGVIRLDKAGAVSGYWDGNTN